MHAALCLECARDLQTKKLPCPICSDAIREVEPGTFDTTWSPMQLEESAAGAKGDSLRHDPKRPGSRDAVGTPQRHGGAGSPDSPLRLPPTPPSNGVMPAMAEAVVRSPPTPPSNGIAPAAATAEAVVAVGVAS